MNKGLEALNTLRNGLVDERVVCITCKTFDKCLNIIESELKDYEKKTKLAKEYKDVNNVAKRLKAFEIINKKNVCIHDLKKSKTLKEYNGCREWKEELTQEEYDLLKEVLL